MNKLQIYRTDGRRRCTHVLRNGEQCNGIALNDVDRCRMHGGGMIKKASKHGLYFRYQTRDLQEMIEEQRDNPRLMDLREQVAIISSMLAMTFQQTKALMLKEERTEMLPGEVNALTEMAERMINAIDKTARVGLAVKMMIHIDVLERLVDQWVEAALNYVKPQQQNEFRKKLSLLCAKVIRDDETKYKDVLKSAAVLMSDRDDADSL